MSAEEEVTEEEEEVAPPPLHPLVHAERQRRNERLRRARAARRRVERWRKVVRAHRKQKIK